jgi:hypothetical protein
VGFCEHCKESSSFIRGWEIYRPVEVLLVFPKRTVVREDIYRQLGYFSKYIDLCLL